MRILACVLTAITLSACGGSSSPVAPTPPPPANIAGNWTGTFTYTSRTSGGRFIEAVTASFTQSGANITGAIAHEVGRSTIQGTVTASTLSGNYTFTLGACTGSASVSGSVGTSQIRFTVPTLASTTCTFFTNGDFLLSR